MPTENHISRREFLIGSIASVLIFNAKDLFGLQGKKVEMTMRSEEAAKYINDEINPRLTRVANDPNQIPGIRDRLREIIINTNKPSGKMLYTAVGGYHPDSHETIAHVDYDIKNKKPLLMIFIPAIQNEIKTFIAKHYRQEEIDLMVAIYYAHEQVHYENTEIKHKYPKLAERALKKDRDLEAREEAEAWGITILEMIRPAIAKGFRLPANLIQNSEAFKQVGDNYNSQLWIDAFKQN